MRQETRSIFGVSNIQNLARKGLENGMPIRPLDLSKYGGAIGNAKAFELWSKILK